MYYKVVFYAFITGFGNISIVNIYDMHRKHLKNVFDYGSPMRISYVSKSGFLCVYCRFWKCAYYKHL